ncbi:MAG: phytoene/squalene synthase family protein, partial [Acidobacteriota bacterium]
FAARLLPSATREQVATLYRFCRVVDDLADDLGDPTLSRAWLDRVYRDLDRGRSELPPIADFLELAERREIPRELALELVRGLRSDLGRVRCDSVDELVRYCYQVASTVGVMMCKVLGASSSQAPLYAVDLGIAMQLTNIARDVAEDLEEDRIYLPGSWVDAETVRRGVGGDGPAAATVFATVERLLDLAHDYYRSADAGIALLPSGARWSILTAGRSYEAIGHRIRGLGPGYWRGRVYTGTGRKVLESAKAAGTLTGRQVAAALGRRQRPRRHRERLHLPLAALPSAALWRPRSLSSARGLG